MEVESLTYQAFSEIFLYRIYEKKSWKPLEIHALYYQCMAEAGIAAIKQWMKTHYGESE